MSLNLAYQHCQKISAQHYENFPVASVLLPRKLRLPISVIYAFARTADDLADEGNLTSKQRLQLLKDYHRQLDLIENSSTEPDKIIFIALAEVIKSFNLPISYFHHLLEAFEQDVNLSLADKASYSFLFTQRNDLLDYCKKSANPVGRLLLHLNNQVSTINYFFSDQICTALQLINFLQDIQQDVQQSQRLYIPLEDIYCLQIKKNDLIKNITSGNVFTNNEKLLLQQQINQAETLLQTGMPLINHLSGRFKFEIAMMVHSALIILNKLKQNRKFSDRPRLNKRDKLAILLASIKSVTYPSSI